MLNPKESIVVVIDIQDKLVTAVGKYNPLDAACKIAKTANMLGIPSIVTEQYPKGLGNTVEDLKHCLSTDNYIEKTSFSALKTPEFKEKLKSFGKKQVVIFGIEAHICVYQTVCDLIKDGYEVYFVKDASASRNKYEFKTGVELIKQHGAYTTCTEIVLFEWLQSSKNPSFKEIQALIK